MDGWIDGWMDGRGFVKLEVEGGYVCIYGRVLYCLEWIEYVYVCMCVWVCMYNVCGI